MTSDEKKKKPEVVLFDLGGVLLDIDYSLTQQAFTALGVKDVDLLYSQAAQSDLFDEMERGRISPADFRLGLREIIGGSNAGDHEIDSAWNALIEHLPAHRLAFVSRLKGIYTTAMLSNTNEIHIACFEAMVADTIGLEVYRSAFDRIYYSSRIDARKPDEAAFSFVLDDLGVAGSDVLFIDDSEQHILAAQKMGIQSILLGEGQEIAEELAWLLE